MEARCSRQKFLRLGAGAMGLSGAMLSEMLRSEPDVVSASRQSTFQDANTAAMACLQDDNTRCAVDVWEKQFALEPYNDQVREELHLSLMAHAIRSLDKGNLLVARAAFDRAKELMPYSGLYGYLEEALARYDRLIYSARMTGMEFIEENVSEFESRYVDIPGLFGGQTKSFALTSKSPGSFIHYPIGLQRAITSDVAMRFVVSPMNFNGYVVATFGEQNRDSYFYCQLAWSSASSATWQVAQAGYPYSTAIGDGGYLTLGSSQWHMMEIRLRGNTVELWVDTSLAGQQVILEYEPGDVGIGTGLNEYESGTTFSAAFDDIAVYSLVY